MKEQGKERKCVKVQDNERERVCMKEQGDEGSV
jgi:hypothetical protein